MSISRCRNNTVRIMLSLTLLASCGIQQAFAGNKHNAKQAARDIASSFSAPADSTSQTSAYAESAAARMSMPPMNNSPLPSGVRFVGNTWNEALIALPEDPKHALFVYEGGRVGNYKVHMLQDDKVVLDTNGKRYDVAAEPKVFSAMWMNQYLNSIIQRIDKQAPYQTEELIFSVLANGEPYNYQNNAVIAKAGPFPRLPENMTAITVRVRMSPMLRTRIEPLAADLK